jgi:1-acyl-sn-glycerol-3-phosphate acyltransferase
MAVKGLSSQLRGVLALLLYTFNTVFWCVPLFALAAVKALMRWPGWQDRCRRWLNTVAENWIGVNNRIQDLLGRTRWRVSGLEALPPRQWYLVLANHQSWVDILVLQRIFHRRIPFLKFFLKQNLFWFPLLGQAWWALDFPFVRRHSHNQLKRNPHLKGRDLEITREACAKFRRFPISVMNFVEGTRFTAAKHARQRSPYQRLLRARAGGIALVLTVMGAHIHRILDVTIVYPGGVGSFWSFLCGGISEIRVHVRALPVETGLLGDYANDNQFRAAFQHWLNELWQSKDAIIQQELETGAQGREALAAAAVPPSSGL